MRDAYRRRRDVAVTALADARAADQRAARRVLHPRRRLGARPSDTYRLRALARRRPRRRRRAGRDVRARRRGPVRLSLASPAEVIEEGIARLVGAVDAWRLEPFGSMRRRPRGRSSMAQTRSSRSKAAEVARPCADRAARDRATRRPRHDAVRVRRAVLGYSKATTHRILQTLTRREFLRLRRGARHVHARRHEPATRHRVPREHRPPARGAPGAAALAESSRRDRPPRAPQRHRCRLHREGRELARRPHVQPRRRHDAGVLDRHRQGDPGLPRRVGARASSPDRARAARTAKTITDRDALREELARDARARITRSTTSRTRRASAAPAPQSSITPDGVQAGISVAGPASRLTLARLAELGPLVREEADAISATVGHRASS